MTRHCTPLRNRLIRAVGLHVWLLAAAGVGCISPIVDPRVSAALEQVAPRVGQLLGIDDGLLPPVRVLPRKNLGGAYGLWSREGVIYVSTEFASMPHEIVAHELVHHWLRTREPGLPYMLEEGLALWVGSETVGVLNQRRALYGPRGPIVPPADLWTLNFDRYEDKDDPVQRRYDQAAFEFVDRAAQPPLESLRFLWDRNWAAPGGP